MASKAPRLRPKIIPTALAAWLAGCALLIDDDYQAVGTGGASSVNSSGGSQSVQETTSSTKKPTDSSDAPIGDASIGDAPGGAPGLDSSTDDAGDAGTDTARVCGESPPAPGGACPEVCTGGCLLGSCLIACLDYQSCKEDSITCPEGFNCHLLCANKQSCEKAIIQCPSAQACTVECAGEQSCKDARIRCTDGTCTTQCAGTYACEHTGVACGEGACEARCQPGSKSPSLNCGSACRCTSCD
jgi:hypothetical protein